MGIRNSHVIITMILDDQNRHQHIISEVKKILVRYLNPNRVYLFGSRAKNTHRQHADFDFAIACNKPNLLLEQKINDEIDVVRGLYKVDIVYLEEVDDEFKSIILKSGALIYEK